MNETSCLAWHWVVKGEDGKLKLRNGRDVPPVGVPLEHEGEAVMCERGLHASRNVIDALFYIPDNATVLCRVKCELIEDEQGDKLVCRKRTVLQAIDCGRLLHEFACRCAERQLKAAGITDERCWNAITTKRKWLKGEATDGELSAAYAAEAARDAAARNAAEAYAAGAAAAERKWQEAELLSMLRAAGWDGM